MSSIPLEHCADSRSQKRKRREYRLARKAQFRRAEPGFSLYEGRTRGKRIRYTFSDDDETSDAPSTRRSARPSGVSTPAEPAGPTYTASGRQVRPRGTGFYGPTGAAEAKADGDAPAEGADAEMPDGHDDSQMRTRGGGRSTRTNGTRGRAHIDGYNALDEMDDESDAVSSENSWDGGGDDDEEDDAAEGAMGDMTEDNEEEDEMSVDGDVDEDGRVRRKSLVVALRYGKERAGSIPAMAATSSPLGTAAPADPKAFGNGANLDGSTNAAAIQTNGISPGSEKEPMSDTVVVAVPPATASQHQGAKPVGSEPSKMAIDP